MTLTFSNESLIDLMKRYKVTESNAVATIAVRLFTENWRKKYKKTIRHWLCTELGHEGTERIHLHGILFTDKTKEEIMNKWIYGIVHFGDYVNERSINYIIKYITKIDRAHKNFIPKVLCSNGIGKRYIENGNINNNIFKGHETNEAYRLPDGHLSSLPIYYRNRIYNENTRERLWINKLDKGERWLNGKKYNINNENEEKRYLRDLEFYQRQNKIKGYGDDTNEWKKENYNVTLNMLRRAKREKEYFGNATLRKFNK